MEKKQKIKFFKSMRFKILLMAILTMVVSSVTILLIVSSRTKKEVNSIVEAYIQDACNTGALSVNLVYQIQGEAGMSTEGLTSALGTVKIRKFESSYCYAVNGEGIMVYHPTAEKIGKPVENDAVNKILANIKSGNFKESGVIKYKYNGKEKYAAYTILGEGACIIVMAVDKEETTKAIDESVQGAVVSAIALLLIFGTIITILTMVIVKPFIKATYAIDKISTLDLTMGDDVTTIARRHDEAGLIGKSIENLVYSLTDTVSTIQNQSDNLNNFAGSLSTDLLETRDSVQSVESVVSEVADGASIQADDTSDASDQVKHIGDALNDNISCVNALNQSVALSKEANDAAIKALKLLTESNRQMSEDIFELKRQTDETNRSVEKINTAVELIHNISSQTSLLSLNASIEAARAGEAGRGFSVVAGEIRTLSEGTNQGAEVITSTIEELIENSKVSVERMNLVTDRANEQNIKLKEVEECFNVLTSENAKIESMTAQLDRQVNDIHIMKDNISASVEQLSAVAEENAASAEECSASVTVVTDIMDKITQETNGLKDASNTIHERLMQFKI